jgi:hypothetical protein
LPSKTPARRETLVFNYLIPVYRFASEPLGESEPCGSYGFQLLRPNEAAIRRRGREFI